MKKQFFFFSILLIVLLFACKSNRAIVGVASEKITSKALNKKMQANAFDFETFSGKAKVHFQDKNFNQSFTANFRVESDEKIWISLTGPFNIEGARVFITQDSIQILDKLNNKYYKQPFDFLSNFIPFRVDFDFIQSLIIGNPLETNLKKQEILLNDGKYLANGSFSHIDVQYIILSEIFRYEKASLKDGLNMSEAELKYGDYRVESDQNFSMYRDLTFDDAQNHVNIQMNFNKIKIGEELTFPFRIPDKFERIE